MNTISALPPLLLVAIGGGTGAMLRYLVGRWALAAFGPGFPVGTLAVNLLGGLVMGLVVGMLARVNEGGEHLRLLIGVGVLGGFTTFSAYSLETKRMIERNDWVGASTYSIGSVIAGLAAVAIGLAMAKRVLG